MPPPSHILPIFLTLVVLVTATPLPLIQSPSANPETHIYICANAPFAAPCTNLHVPVSECIDIPDDFAGKISSAGPDEGTFCTLYSDKACHGDALPFTNPGIRELRRYGYEDVARSVRCDFITGWKSHP
ncbi:hypothetical protein FB567DRAFT_612186 [Paraphoma chrysanthemicola]|uniref:Uncharacterized protein n=1 Tax=Paraphoma chrysanthemicola TaxID=798071 RepID=A0A8K0VSP2_9PLEO|nr:hypothetical protein FB567DRAFT_612186 [Paraphoma chrysanthemicola]